MADNFCKVFNRMMKKYPIANREYESEQTLVYIPPTVILLCYNVSLIYC